MWRWKTSNLKQLSAEKIRQQLHTYFPAPPKLQPYGAILICLLLLLLLRVTTLWVLWNSPNSFCWNFPQLFVAHLLMLHYLCWLYVVIIAILHITIAFGAKCSKWFDKQKILYMVVTRTATVLLNNDVTPINKQMPLSSITLSPVVSLSLGILHEWMRTQILAKPPSNLLHRFRCKMHRF